MATIDLDNIQFYSPNPPPSKPSGTLEPITSTGTPMGNSPVCIPPSTFPAASKPSAQTEHPRRLERPFASSPAPSLTESILQQHVESPHAVRADFNKVLEEFGVAEIETVDLTGDDSLDSLLSWISGELCQSPSPCGSLPSFEGVGTHGGIGDEISFIPQSPFLDDGDSVAVSARPASLSGAVSDRPCSGCQDRPGSSGAVTLAQLDVHPDTSLPSACSTSQPETRNAESSNTVAHCGRPARRQQPGHTRIEVVIPSRRRTRDTLALEIPDSQGSVQRKSSLAYGSERHSMYADSDEESEPPTRPVKRRRVSLRSSPCHHCQPTASVSASAARSLADNRPRRMSPVDENANDESGDGPDVGCVLQSYTENGRESGHDGHIGSSLYMTSNAPMSAGGAMTLAAAVAQELYSLLMRPSTMGVAVASRSESGSPHPSASYEERMSDWAGGRARWSEEDDKLLLLLKRSNTPWGEIKKRFPRRTLGSLRQRCSTLNNRSQPSNRGRRRRGRSE